MVLIERGIFFSHASYFLAAFTLSTVFLTNRRKINKKLYQKTSFDQLQKSYRKLTYWYFSYFQKKIIFEKKLKKRKLKFRLFEKKLLSDWFYISQKMLLFWAQSSFIVPKWFVTRTDFFHFILYRARGEGMIFTNNFKFEKKIVSFYYNFFTLLMLYRP